MKRLNNHILCVLSALLLCASCKVSQDAISEFKYVASVDEIEDTVQFQDIVESYRLMQGKVLVFDNKNGAFRRSIEIPHTVASLFCNENEIVADRHELACTVVPNDERFFVFSTEQPENISQAYLADVEDKAAIDGQTTMHENGFFFSNFWRCQTWKISANYNKEDDKYVAYKSVKCEGPWQIIPMEFMASDKNNAYKVVSSDDIAMIKSFVGLPIVSKQEVDQSNPYEIYCSVEENDNPVVVEFMLK